MRFQARFLTILKAIIQVKAHSRKGKNGQVAQVKAHARYIQSAGERKEMIDYLVRLTATGQEPKHKTTASALGLARHLSKQDKGATYHVARTEDGHHVVRKGEAPAGGDRIHVKAGRATLHRADGETRSLKHLKGPIWLEHERNPRGHASRMGQGVPYALEMLGVKVSGTRDVAKSQGVHHALRRALIHIEDSVGIKIEDLSAVLPLSIDINQTAGSEIEQKKTADFFGFGFSGRFDPGRKMSKIAIGDQGNYAKSFIHEFGHYIDYMAGSDDDGHFGTHAKSDRPHSVLSQETKSLLMRCVDDALSDANGAVSPLISMTEGLKENEKEYYRTRTEVFARLFESYMVIESIKKKRRTSDKKNSRFSDFSKTPNITSDMVGYIPYASDQYDKASRSMRAFFKSLSTDIHNHLSKKRQEERNKRNTSWIESQVASNTTKEMELLIQNKINYEHADRDSVSHKANIMALKILRDPKTSLESILGLYSELLANKSHFDIRAAIKAKDIEYVAKRRLLDVAYEAKAIAREKAHRRLKEDQAGPGKTQDS